MMTALDSLKKMIPAADSNGRVEGKLSTVQACLDPLTGEFFNVGVLFVATGSGKSNTVLKMLDTYERLKCLYGQRLDVSDLNYFLQDIETVIYEHKDRLNDLNLGEYVRISEGQYAAGNDINSIVAEFYDFLVSLGRITERDSNKFRHKTTATLKHDIFSAFKIEFELEANSIIHEELIPVSVHNRMAYIDIPLATHKTVGNIVSAWYANEHIVRDELKNAASNLRLAYHLMQTEKASLSVLRPTASTEMKKSTYRKLEATLANQISVLEREGIEVIQSDSVEELSEHTIKWWKEAA